MKEFNLSEKIMYCECGEEDCPESIDVKDVKEFIRLLKEDFSVWDASTYYSICEKINDRAGERLI